MGIGERQVLRSLAWSCAPVIFREGTAFLAEAARSSSHAGLAISSHTHALHSPVTEVPSFVNG